MPSLLLLTALTVLVDGAAPPLPCPRVRSGAVTVDGFFQDWQELAGASGVAGQGDLRWELRAVRDADRIYFVFGAQDDGFAPTPAGPNPTSLAQLERPRAGDQFALVFGAPGGSEPPLTVLVLPGDLEDRPPQALLLRGAGPGQRRAAAAESLPIDGATRPGGGWILEFALPWAALPWGAAEPAGMRLELRLQDQDPGDPPPGTGLPAAGSVAGTTLRLQFPEEELDRRLLLERLKLPPSARADLEQRAQIGGDPRQEQVLVFGGRLAVLGEGLGEGAFYVYELPFAERLRPVRLQTTDLTGDGVDEILLGTRLAESRGEERHEQEFLGVYQYGENTIRPLFFAEVVHEGPGGQRVSNELTIDPPDASGCRALRLRLGEARKVDVHDYRDVDEGYETWYEPILLPWSARQEMVYRYIDGRFLRDEEATGATVAPGRPAGAAGRGKSRRR